MTESTEKICFVISPIGEQGSEIRQHADQVLQHIIRPSVEECGYKAVRADAITEPGIITDQIIQHLMNDPLVIADLTDRNPNVFYELAFRHGARKPVVHICQKGENIPFDISGMRIVKFDRNDWDSIPACHKEIVGQIRAVENNPDVLNNPITAAIDLQPARQSENPVEQMFAEIISNLRTMSGRIDQLENLNEERLASILSNHFPNHLLYIQMELYNELRTVQFKLKGNLNPEQRKELEEYHTIIAKRLESIDRELGHHG